MIFRIVRRRLAAPGTWNSCAALAHIPRIVFIFAVGFTEKMKTDDKKAFNCGFAWRVPVGGGSNGAAS